MAGICCGVVGETETAAPIVEPSSRPSRRRRLELRPFKVVAESAVQPPSENGPKRQKIDLFPLPCEPLVVENRKSREDMCKGSVNIEKTPESNEVLDSKHKDVSASSDRKLVEESPKYGMTSVCGRRRDMEDAVSIQPTFTTGKSSFFGVFDGHGCSHVTILKHRLFNSIDLGVYLTS